MSPSSIGKLKENHRSAELLVLGTKPVDSKSGANASSDEVIKTHEIQSPLSCILFIISPVKKVFNYLITILSCLAKCSIIKGGGCEVVGLNDFRYY